MCSKQAKIPQTDYTIGGRDISNTAIPYYKKGVTQLGNYMENVQNRMDPYLEKYINPAKAAEYSDFQRNYQRAMGQQTAQNYAATGGGYSSANQLGYDDLQRYYNHYASELYAQGLNQANQMAAQEYNMLTGALGSYGNAYNLGKEYSDNEQYNKLVDKANKNWFSNVMSTVGSSLSAIPTPWTQAIGAGLSTAGYFTKNNADELADQMAGLGNNARGEGGSSNSLGGAFQKGYEGIGTLINDWKSGNKQYFPEWVGGKGIQANKVNTGGSLFSSNDPWSAKVGG